MALKKQPKPKERRRLAIPAELRDSLRQVWELIEEAKHDPDIDLSFEDAIQVGAVCGGRTGGKARPYELTYHPTGDTEPGRWFLKLHPLEIEDIADGRMSEIAMYCCTSPNCGQKFRDASVLCGCDYVPDPEYARLSIEVALPRLETMGITGLTNEANRATIQAVLGDPQESGGGASHEMYGYIRPWIKYHRSDCQLRFEFCEQGLVEAVDFMPADWKPGR
jgi:hypothetical protein